MAGAGLVTGGLSLSEGKTNNDYRSVEQASGFQAGGGGYEITVGNHTGLIGGQLASTATPDKNILNTGSLSYQDLDNHSHWSAHGGSLALSGNPLASAWGSAGAALGLATPQNHDSTSTTQSGVAPGTVIVRNDPNQDLSGLKHDQTQLDGNGVKNGFDPNKIARNQETGQLASEVGMRGAGDIEQAMGWKPGGQESTVLHGLIGAGASALGGGHALQGAAGATASEAASRAMQDYLVNQGIDPNSAAGTTLMQLGGTALGAAVGGGSGAAAGLAGEKYNEQLHPDLMKGVMAKVNEFAKENGLSPEEAQNRLLAEAMRLQDSYDSDTFKASGGASDDALARSFLERNPLFIVEGKEVNIFQPEARDDREKNAYPLYQYLQQHPDAAKTFYDAQVSAYGQNDPLHTPPEVMKQVLGTDFYHLGWDDYQSNYAADEARAIASQQAASFLGNMVLTGSTAGLSAGVSFLEAANAAREGGVVSNLLSYMLASRVGAGLTAGAVNAGSQEVQGRPFHWTDAGIATATGALGVGGGLGWNAAVSAIGGYWQAVIDNKIYKENNDPARNALTSGMTGTAGYLGGERTTGWMISKMPDSLAPVISGNAIESGAGELSSILLNGTVDNKNNIERNHD